MNKTQEEREFIVNENKNTFPYIKLKNVSHGVLFDFKWELNFKNLSIEACKNNNYELLGELIKFGLDVNVKNRYGYSILSISCEMNSLECVKLLIKHDVYFNGVDLCLSCLHRSYDCTELLLEVIKTKNANDRFEIFIDAINYARINKNKLAYNFFSEYVPTRGVSSDFRNELQLYSVFFDCFEENNFYLLKKLINIGVDVNYRVDLNFELGVTPLMYACIHNSDECAKILIESGADVNIRSDNGKTPLMYACRNNSYECVKILIESGADVNAEVFLGYTTLKLAKEHSDNRIVDLLIQNSAHE